ncbi:MAG: DJ-1 family glyoxalase III [Verrucomicrobiota bacterium]
MKALIPLAKGFEEIEAIVVIDVLRRAGIDVIVASLEHGTVTASRKTKHLAGSLLQDVLDQDFDLIVLPGGRPGADHLRDHLPLINKLKAQDLEGRWLAAICAAPLALHRAGILDGKVFTSHPTTVNELPRTRTEEQISVDGKLITAQGAGVSFEFAFEIVKQLCGSEKVNEVNQGLLFQVQH